MARGRFAAGAAAALLAGAACGSAPGGNAASEAEASDRNAIAGQLARVEIRPGLWETSTVILSVSQPDLPHAMAERLKGPRPPRRLCITPERAARPNGGFLSGDDERCTHSGFDMRSGRLEGTTVCPHPEGGETRATLSGRYAPEQFDYALEVTTPGFEGRPMTLRGRQTGRRIGDCPQQGETRR